MQVINCFGEKVDFLEKISFDMIRPNKYMLFSPCFQQYLEKLFLWYREVFLVPLRRQDSEGKIRIGVLGKLSNKKIAEIDVSVDKFQVPDDFIVNDTDVSFQCIKNKYQNYIYNRIAEMLKEFHKTHSLHISRTYFPGNGYLRSFQVIAKCKEGAETKTIAPPNCSFPLLFALREIEKDISWKDLFPQNSLELKLLESLETWQKFWNDVESAVKSLSREALNRRYLEMQWGVYKKGVEHLMQSIPDLENL